MSYTPSWVTGTISHADRLIINFDHWLSCIQTTISPSAKMITTSLTELLCIRMYVPRTSRSNSVDICVLNMITFLDQSSRVECNGMDIAYSHNSMGAILGLFHRVGKPLLVSAISNAGGLGEFVVPGAILHANSIISRNPDSSHSTQS